MSALVVPGLFATMALPAYATATSSATSRAQAASAALSRKIQAGAQTIAVDASAAPITVKRDGFGATAPAPVALASVHIQGITFAGPSVAAYLKNPPYPSFSLSKVVSVADKYAGVPYIFGGASPSGFDCSGFTMYVYAQFGIALPHSAAAQGRLGKPISRADARPGDVVVIDGGSHVGIYLGNGRMIDAPEAGGVVSARAIWTDAYYIVRFGI